MTISRKSNFSFRSVVGAEVIANGYRFVQKPFGLEIRHADGFSLKEPTSHEPRDIPYRLNDHGSCYKWDNHIAPTLTIRREDESIYRVVIDPFLADTLISEQSWKDLQNCPSAVLMHADRTGMLKIIPDEDSLSTVCAVANAKNISDPLGEHAPDTVAAITGFEGRNRGRLGNPCADGMIKDETGAPSLTQTIKYFEDWLAPLKAFQDWKRAVISDAKPSAQPQKISSVAVTSKYRAV